MSEFLLSATLHYKASREDLVPDALSRRLDFLAALKLTIGNGVPLAFCNTVVSEETKLLFHLAVTPEHDTCWGEHAHLEGS